MKPRKHDYYEVMTQLGGIYLVSQSITYLRQNGPFMVKITNVQGSSKTTRIEDLTELLT